MTLRRRKDFQPQIKRHLPIGDVRHGNQCRVLRTRNGCQIAVFSHLWRNSIGINFRIVEIGMAPTKIHGQKTCYRLKQSIRLFSENFGNKHLHLFSTPVAYILNPHPKKISVACP